MTVGAFLYVAKVLLRLLLEPPDLLSFVAGEAKSLKKPPAGVDDITAVILILLEGNPKDKSWGAACKVHAQHSKRDCL